MTIDLEARRAELLVLRARLEHAAQRVVDDEDGQGELSSASGDQHLADHASDLHDRELDAALVGNAHQVLVEIDEALALIDAGKYGRCTVCGAEIDEERLAALPYATLCVRDKRLTERP